MVKYWLFHCAGTYLVPLLAGLNEMSHRALKTVPGTKQVLIRGQLFLWFVLLLSSLLSCPVTSLVRACMRSRPCFHHRLIPDPSSHCDFPLLFLLRHVSPSSPHCPAFFHSPIFGKWFLPKGNFAGFVHRYPGQRKTGTRKVLFDGGGGGQDDSSRLPQGSPTTWCFGFPSHHHIRRESSCRQTRVCCMVEKVINDAN